MDVDDRTRVAKEAGYVLLSQGDGQAIYGRDDLPGTVEFDGVEWTCSCGTSTSIPSVISTSAMLGFTRSSPSRR